MKWTFIFLFNCIFFYSSFAQNVNTDSTFSFPKSIGFVNDFENVLSENQEKKLSKKLHSFEKKTSNEIAIVTIHNCYPYSSLQEYTIALANTWGVGKKEENNGVTIVFGKEIREIILQMV